MTTTETAAHTGTCAKCDGLGAIRAFSHIAGGVCFWCHGTGRLEIREGEPGKPVVNSRQIETVRVLGHDHRAERYADHWKVYGDTDDQGAGGIVYVFDDGEVTMTVGITDYQNAAAQKKIIAACLRAVAALPITDAN